MRILTICGAWCIAVAPVLGSSVQYTFNVTAGSVVRLNDQTASNPLEGTFAITVSQAADRIAPSDTFLLGGANMHNTQTIVVSMAGFATATIQPGDFRFVKFRPNGPGHIEEDGLPSSVLTHVDLREKMVFTGGFNETYEGVGLLGDNQPLSVLLSVSQTSDDVIQASLEGTLWWYFKVPESDPDYDPGLKAYIHIEGTAHAVPDPTLGGLAALGVGGAGFWLRRRYL